MSRESNYSDLRVESERAQQRFADAEAQRAREERRERIVKLLGIINQRCHEVFPEADSATLKFEGHRYEIREID